MLPATVLSALTLLSLSVPPAGPVPVRVDLAIGYSGQAIKAVVTFAEPEFLGAVILSLRPELAQSLVLPPLLNNVVVLGLGQGRQNHLVLLVPQNRPPLTGIPIYAQGVVLGTQGVEASGVEKLTR